MLSEAAKRFSSRMQDVVVMPVTRDVLDAADEEDDAKNKKK